MPEFGPRYESDVELLLRSKRERLLNTSDSLFERATAYHTFGEGVYLQDEPALIAGLEEVESLMLTRDGERPFQEESKEYLKLLRPRLSPEFLEEVGDAAMERIVWVCGYPRYQQPHRLTPEQFQPEPNTLEDLRYDVQSLHGRSQTEQLNWLQERMERYLLTPYKDLQR